MLTGEAQPMTRKVERPGVGDERHPIGRHLYNQMKKSSQQAAILSSMQLDWSGVNQLFTNISAAFLCACDRETPIAEKHINNLIEVYMYYMQAHPGTLGSSIDRLNLILFYVRWHVAPDWYRLKFQGGPVGETLPGDILIERGVSRDWFMSAFPDDEDYLPSTDDEQSENQNTLDILTLGKKHVLKFVSGQPIGVGAKGDITPDQEKEFMDLLLPDRWKRYQEHFGADAPSEGVLLAFQEASIPAYQQP